MARPTKLTDAEIDAALPSVPGWKLEAGKLHRTFAFADFVTAFAFMTRCAFAAERLNHHPDWSNVWSKVDVSLWTHDAGGITSLDFDLARAMNDAA
jgi:4a-hydroxytetrahydrobiopterin dehydratase